MNAMSANHSVAVRKCLAEMREHPKKYPRDGRIFGHVVEAKQRNATPAWKKAFKHAFERSCDD
jgi:hypothetical protein